MNFTLAFDWLRVMPLREWIQTLEVQGQSRKKQKHLVCLF